MRTFPCILFAGLAAAPGALAQTEYNNDFGLMFGFSQRNASIRNDVIRGKARISTQFNYGRLLGQSSAGRVYFEIPVMAAAGLNGTIDDQVTGRGGGIVFVTPGIRAHLDLASRFSVYFAGGFGAAHSRDRVGTPTGQGLVTTRNSYTSAAGNYGGGIDLRLAERWSLRVEARDFRAKKETRIPGRNTILQAGFAFRW